MESVRLIFPIDDVIRPGAQISIYTDDSSGTVDYTTPIACDQPARLPEDSWSIHNETAHNMDAHNGSWGRSGHNDGVHNHSPLNEFEDTVEFVGGSFYGPKPPERKYKFGAIIADAEGKSSGTPPEVQVVINTSPRPPSGLAATALSGGALSFSFTKSVDL